MVNTLLKQIRCFKRTRFFYLVCATRTITLRCPLWLWERCSRKDSGGSPTTSVFRCSTCTCVGNSACSMTENLWSLMWHREMTVGLYSSSILKTNKQKKTEHLTNLFGLQKQVLHSLEEVAFSYFAIRSVEYLLEERIRRSLKRCR